MKKRFHFIFRGRVQGVGFRWTARNGASGLGLTGWVMNMWDGSVEMEVQGREETIQKLLSHLDQSVFIQIDSVDRQEIPVRTDEISFYVRGD